MGSQYNFKCDGCGYEACVSGGLDCGFIAVVQTSICNDCKELDDVLVGRQGEVGLTGDPDYDEDIGHCSICDGVNVTPWLKSRPCPKCGESMVKGNEVRVLWD